MLVALMGEKRGSGKGSDPEKQAPLLREKRGRRSRRGEETSEGGVVGQRFKRGTYQIRERKEAIVSEGVNEKKGN